MGYKNDENLNRYEDWEEIERLVFVYKQQFKEGSTKEEISEAMDAAYELTNRFTPLFKKYMILLRTGQIEFSDPDIKSFVGTFIDDPRLHRALKRQKSKKEYRAGIYKKFGFILGTYGQLSKNEMLSDLQMSLLILAKRYKQVGKNFCAYVYNCFRYEVSRTIKKHIENPLSLNYKNCSYEDFKSKSIDKELEIVHEDLYYESDNGIPNMLWITGETCSDIFSILTTVERKIVVKYYAEEYNDKQIAEMLGLHINTINQKRRQAIIKIANTSGIDISKIKRNRHSGRKTLR